MFTPFMNTLVLYKSVNHFAHPVQRKQACASFDVKNLYRQCDLDDLIWLIVRPVDGLVWADDDTVEDALVLDCHIITKHAEAVDVNPRSDLSVPADDRILDESTSSDCGALHDDSVLDAATSVDLDVRADHDVWSDYTVLADLGARVDQNLLW